MAKPSLAALLTASGHTLFTPDLIQQARDTLYTHAAGLDNRDWDSIMASDNPLQAAWDALLLMYQDPVFLWENASHLTSLGHTPAQVEWTYRLMYERLGIEEYDPDWAVGSWYEDVSKMGNDQVYIRAKGDYIASLPAPTLTLTGSTTGIQAALSEAGTLSLSVTGTLGNFKQGSNTLGEQDSIRQGFLTLTGSTSGKSSLASSEYLILGTSAVEDITGTNGDDLIFSAGGDDILRGTAGTDKLFAGEGDDTFSYDIGAGVTFSGHTLNGGAGTDRLDAWNGHNGANTTLTDSAFQHISNIEELDVASSGTSVVTLGTHANTAFSSGLTLSNSNTSGNLELNAAAATFDITVSSTIAQAYTLTTGSGNDNLTTGSGGDVIVSGAGDDYIQGRQGIDMITGGGGSDTFAYSALDVGNGRDIIQDFTQGIDTIQIALTGSTIDASVFQTVNGVGGLDWSQFKAGNVVIDQWTDLGTEHIYVFAEDSSGGNNEALSVNIGDNSGIQASDLSFNLTGTSSNDQLTGSAGADLINGGKGADNIQLGVGDGIQDTVVQGLHDSFRPFQLSFENNEMTSLSFNLSGLDIVSGFSAGIGGDLLDVEGSTDTLNIAGTEALFGSLEEGVNYLPGNLNTSTNVFTISTEGSDSLITMGEGGQDFQHNESHIVLLGVKSSDLDVSNFI